MISAQITYVFGNRRAWKKDVVRKQVLALAGSAPIDFDILCDRVLSSIDLYIGSLRPDHLRTGTGCLFRRFWAGSYLLLSLTIAWQIGRAHV